MLDGGGARLQRLSVLKNDPAHFSASPAIERSSLLYYRIGYWKVYLPSVTIEMNTQPVTPTSASMPLLVIPAAVTHLGSQLSRLPDELLLQIFKILATSMFPPTSRFHTVINPGDFVILNRHYAINRIRNVSPTFKDFFMEAFYENFTFAFRNKPILNFDTDYLTSFPPTVPALHFRHHLRSMRIGLPLETYYFTAPILHNQPRTTHFGRSLRKIVTKQQFLTFCPCARFLQLLTRDGHGFCNLRFLHLHIRVDDSYMEVDERYLRVLEEVRFVVKASRVELVVTNRLDDVKACHMEVAKRIVVVH
ncbi:hypothetical protein E8E12_008067 [Didymella heteroderae]|uniref:Uncharacterized protein n=1 Tax=Didymella heteroderae TaxID=1769908 RepID=A0A9P5BZX4_9PLEO|nr:hypothetical protein E8E12_008067 [Didymella heteroderae]